MEPILRFFRYVRPLNASECWLWTGAITKQLASPGSPRGRGVGYGVFSYDSQGSRGGPSSMAAHRFAYKAFVGPIPEGYEIDHTCMVRRCVNPKHLQAVTKNENARRAVASHKVALARAAKRRKR